MSSIDTEPMMGNFIPMSSAEGLFLVPPSHPRSPRRLRSRSPRRRRKEPGVHLHLSLTDSQMDKLTSITKEDASRAKTHRRSGTIDGCDLSMASMQHHQSVTDELPMPPLPPGPIPAFPPRGKVASPASASSEEQHLDGPYVHHTRGRSHNENHKDTYGYASTAPYSPPTRSDIRASSPGKKLHIQESISTPATSTHATVESNMGRHSSESGPSMHYHSEGSGRPQPPPQNRQQVIEEPGMTDASSSTYSMDELIKAIPHIHPLYVKRIAEMASPNRSPGLSPEHPPSPLLEYTA
ncbi:hypothetical protein Sste5346_000310 [Sporothrix stenoceras]|uniref:Uncharacterized protein n=1 Tax=Sporothrix stenoceras TaxID=5173 RepID=A0ABR3ZTI2_9PEZI